MISLNLFHFPVVEPERKVPEVSYGYDSCGYQPQFQDTAKDRYQDSNYNTGFVF